VSRIASLALAFLLVVSQAPAALAQSSGPSAGAEPVQASGKQLPAETAEFAPDRVVVKWREAGKGPQHEKARGLARIAEMRLPGGPAVLSTSGRGVQQVLDELRADPAVEYAEPDYLISVANEGAAAAVAVNDPGNGNQYALNHMRVRDAWSLSKGGNNIVAVLDTGVSYVHADLQGRVLPGHNFVGGNSNARDDNGHGTMVAGIIAANANNGTGIAGISWSDKILPVKVLNSSGGGYASDLTAGIIYAADQGASIINMSLGGFGWSQFTLDAINHAWSKGAILVAAAGNNGREQHFYPASYPNVISVSATQRDDEFSNWSSFGPGVTVSAPGASIYTTNCGGCSTTSAGGTSYIWISGTSFATPNTAGVLALIKARYPSWSNQQVVNRLTATVDDLGYPGWDNRYGHGRVNALRALGGSAAAVKHGSGDAAEPNNSLASAKAIAINTTVRPSIYPAGDVDFFRVTAPRGGRIDIAVTAIAHVLDSPWHRSTLPIDPILEVYNTSGGLIVRVDDPSDFTATERASVQLSNGGTLIIKVSNWFPNGNKGAYSLTTSFVDNVAPTVVGRSPAPNATAVDGMVRARVTFSEAVTGVDSASVTLRDAGGRLVPAAVSYDSSRREATLTPTWGLTGDQGYTLGLTNAIKDVAGNSLASTSWKFTTGKSTLRRSGPDRYATAAAVSASRFAPGVPVVYLATGLAYPDALSAGPAAALGNGPLLLVTRDSIPDATRAELIRLKPGRVVIVGGSGVVSASVASAAAAYTSGTVSRLAGADRYATAAAISRATFASGVPLVYLATGANYPDALAGAAAAARAKVPVLLVTHNSIPDSTRAELTRLKPGRVVILGGSGVVSAGVASAAAAYTSGTVSRLAGADRYATAVAVSSSGFAAGAAATVYIATGTTFPDGLAGGPVAGLHNSPLLLVPSGSLPQVVADELRRLNPSTVIVLGGKGIISDSVLNAISALGP
jgi:subtilisin family serine protease/putative cell wall-binding protein